MAVAGSLCRVADLPVVWFCFVCKAWHAVCACCRKDMAALEHSAATLDMSEPCARCSTAVGEPPPATAGPSGGAVPPFFLFPSGNAFHGTCLAAEVSKLQPAPQQQRIQALLLRLSQVTVQSYTSSMLLCCRSLLNFVLTLFSSSMTRSTCCSHDRCDTAV